MKRNYLKFIFISIVVFLITGFYFKERFSLGNRIPKENYQYQGVKENETGIITKETTKTEENSTTTEPEEDLTPRQVVERFIEADMLGARLGGEIAKEAPEIRKYYTLSSGFPTSFAYEGDFTMVIKGYEIINEFASENESYYYIEIKYSCEKGIASGSMGVAEEIKEGPFIIIPCPIFFQKTYPRYFENPTSTASIKFNLQENSQTIVLELIKDKEKWKLNYPSICPHISNETFQKHLESFQK